jgi:hypothetical protein
MRSFRLSPRPVFLYPKLFRLPFIDLSPLPVFFAFKDLMISDLNGPSNPISKINFSLQRFDSGIIIIQKEGMEWI